MTGLCIDRPHPRMLLSRAVCDGGLFGHESMCLSDPQTETRPRDIFVRGSVSLFHLFH